MPAASSSSFLTAWWLRLCQQRFSATRSCQTLFPTQNTSQVRIPLPHALLAHSCAPLLHQWPDRSSLLQEPPSPTPGASLPGYVMVSSICCSSVASYHKDQRLLESSVFRRNINKKTSVLVGSKQAEEPLKSSSCVREVHGNNEAGRKFQILLKRLKSSEIVQMFQHLSEVMKNLPESG